MMADLPRTVFVFAADHWPTVVAFFTGGGAWAIYIAWRDRVRVSVEMLNEPIDIDGKHVNAAPVFEVENLGARPTSLAREVQFKGYPGADRKGKCAPR